MTIITHPNSILKDISKRVEMFDDSIKDIVQKMIEIIIKGVEGVQVLGLAAPQIGISKSIFVTNVGNDPLVFINPEITYTRNTKEKIEKEGCLSIPNIMVDVKRRHFIDIKAQDVNGKFFKRTYRGLMSRVCQHEYDHLLGILIIDYDKQSS